MLWYRGNLSAVDISRSTRAQFLLLLNVAEKRAALLALSIRVKKCSEKGVCKALAIGGPGDGKYHGLSFLFTEF